VTVPGFDLSVEDFQRISRAVGEKLSALTDIPLERAVELAGSVVTGVVLADDDGLLTFRDEDGTQVVRLPFSAFSALLGDEEDPE